MSSPSRRTSAREPASPAPGQIRASIAANQAAARAVADGAARRGRRRRRLAPQFKRNRPKVLIGAAVAGFVIGGGIAAILGRRR